MKEHDLGVCLIGTVMSWLCVSLDREFAAEIARKAPLKTGATRPETAKPCFLPHLDRVAQSDKSFL